MEIDRDELMQATIELLQDNSEKEIYNKEYCAKELKKIAEEYAKRKDLSKFIRVLAKALTEDELYYMLRIFVNEYDNI